MRIAIVDWFPRVCGATDFALHLAAGTPRGSTADLVTFSKSGKPLKDFAHPERWKVYKIADAVEVLDSYDLVVLGDVVCFAPQVVKRAKELPYYVDVVRRLTVPWTAMYHGGTYPSKYDDAMRAVLSAESFSGTIFTTRLPEAKARLDPIAPRPIRYAAYPFLPYDLAWRGPAVASKADRRTAMMTARIAVNKGQNAVLGLLPKIAGDVELWGYNSFGLPSIGWRLWELGNALGYRVAHDVELREDAKHLTHPRAVRFYTGRWGFSAGRGKAAAQYRRAYSNLDEIDWSPLVHLSLANDDFKGTLEYVTLDAIAAGRVAVVPEHALEFVPRGAYGRGVIAVPYTRCNLWAKSPDPADGVRGGVVGDVGAIVDEVNGALTRTDASVAAIRADALYALSTRHAPKKVFKKLIEGVLG